MGYADVNRLFKTIGLTTMNKVTFFELVEFWGKKLWKYWELKRKEAHEEEIKLAMANGDVDEEDCPLLCVTADGGWYTRCNRGHTYKAKSGCQVIRGILSKKVLFISMKQSYCSFCNFHHRVNPTVSIPSHSCYKNWSGPPQGMEQQGIVDGFLAGIK